MPLQNCAGKGTAIYAQGEMTWRLLKIFGVRWQSFGIPSRGCRNRAIRMLGSFDVPNARVTGRFGGIQTKRRAKTAFVAVNVRDNELVGWTMMAIKDPRKIDRKRFGTLMFDANREGGLA
jgi:hypothetical protein